MIHCARMLPLLLALMPVLGTAAGPASADEPANALRTDSRAPYVHRLTLYDEDGQAIDPTDDLAGPYSPRTTCGKCHPYAEIARGWHFNPRGDKPEWNTARAGEPWWWTDERVGLAVPISDRGWPHLFTTRQAGVDPWQMVKRFGSHTPGGGYGEPTPAQIAKSPHAARWRVSGTLEIDCMICHAADGRYDPAERARQIERENFKWAATAALGLAAVRGEAAKVPDDWDPLAEPDPDHPEQAGPKIEWDTARFDADNRVLFAITRRPPPERCYFCHTVRQVGRAHELEEMLEPRDVHLAAGLTCVDCHRNTIDHQIVRGYDGEAAATGQPWRAAFSCKGCHLGVEGASDPASRTGGRYGAPRPAHRGLPLVHFEKLACTACHSGPRPQMQPLRFQTARAHGLGLATRSRRDDQPPLVYGPVFTRRIDGKIAPQLEAWEQVYMRKQNLVPIPEVVRAFAQDAQHLSAASPEQVRDGILKTLKNADYYEYSPSYMLAPLLLMRNPLIEYEYRTGRPMPDTPLRVVMVRTMRGDDILPRLWPIAHDVRPASQALGTGGCTDCHSFDGPIFAGSVLPPTKGAKVSITNTALRGDDPIETAYWNLAFDLRPAFKIVALAGAAVLPLVLLYGLIAGVTRPTTGHEPMPPEGDSSTGRKPVPQEAGVSTGYEPVPQEAGASTSYEPVPQVGPRARLAHVVLHTLAILAVLAQVFTGLGGEWFFDGVRGWLLLFHMAAAGLFIVTLVAVALLWLRRMLAGDPALGPWQRRLYWLGLLLGWCIIGTMTLPMLPVLGPGQMDEMAEIHEFCAILFVIVMVAHTAVSLLAKATRPRARSAGT